MARDKSKDDKLFNCSEEWEIKYVSSLYSDQLKIQRFLINNCLTGRIKNFSHKQVYNLIKEELGLPVPD